jgi:tRNA-2-methylthio-N6-dimethylallyladenosine synthase
MTKKKYHIITIGCAMNFSDSERISSFLDDLGYAETRQRSKADLVIINTCGVKQTSESRVYGLVPQLKKDNGDVKIVITGCVSGRPDVQRRMKQVDLWLPIKDMVKLAEFLNAGQKQLPDSYLKIAPKYNSRISAQVPIGTGCDNFCSYCVVPYARGREVYRSSAEIVSEVRDLVARGYKEINLIAQNVNSYKDGEVNFAQLLKSVNSIEGNFWIRFVSSHPKDMSEQLIKTIAECGKCCHHIHLPVQAGDDEVLARMNRKYTVEHYRNLLVLIRSYLPDVSITTDIIVGFPGETDEQFEHTADLAEWAKFDNIYIGKYSQRPYTAAAKFKDDVTRLEKKRREEALMDIMRRTAAENHQKYLGQTTEILVEQFSKGNFFGRTRDNTFVKISNKDIGSDLVGQIVAVRITEARDFGMDGELIA